MDSRHGKKEKIHGKKAQEEVTFATMAELVYATDLKSVALAGLRVRVPLVVPYINA